MFRDASWGDHHGNINSHHSGSVPFKLSCRQTEKWSPRHPGRLLSAEAKTRPRPAAGSSRVPFAKLSLIWFWRWRPQAAQAR